LILYDDEIYKIAQMIISDCKELDEDKEGVIQIDKLLDLLNKYHSEKTLSPKEVTLLYMKIKNDHPEKYPYNLTQDYIFKFKVDIIRNGLMESSVTKLEQYLRKLFETYDNEKNGLISPGDMTTALSKADKIVLSQMQLYILRSFAHRDP